MTEWAAKKFWSDVATERVDRGYEIRLDGRPLRTPARSPLVLPTEGLSDAIAAEWRAVDEIINPRVMPATRMANSAIEKVAPQMAAVADHLAAYGETDLLCYRAEGPDGLIARQIEEWDPWLDWAAEELNARLRVTSGIVPVDQPRDALQALRREMDDMSPFELAAFHDLVLLPGSLVLGFAAARAKADPEDLWQTSRLDERWQISLWGHDDEAERMAAERGASFVEAARFYALAGDR